MEEEFTIEQTDDGFVIRYGEIDIKLTSGQIADLKSKLLSWTDLHESTFQSQSGTVHSIRAVPVREAGVYPDAIGESLLVTLTGPSGAQSVFALSPDQAFRLSGALLYVLNQMRRGPAS